VNNALGCADYRRPVPAFLIREKKLIVLLSAYILVGLFFMLIPGTLVGVLNLFSISSQRSAAAASSAWIDAHGHAQLFGWIGTFILGIGYYNLPNLRKTADAHFQIGWVILALWTMGVFVHWSSGLWQWQTKMLLPVSAVLELSASVLFIVASSRAHRLQPQANRKIDNATVAVICGSLGLLFSSALLLLLLASAATSLDSHSRLMVVASMVWTFIVPVSTGLSARWFPAVAGAAKYHPGLFMCGIVGLYGGTACYLLHLDMAAALIILLSTVAIVAALRIFGNFPNAPKTTGIHASFRTFLQVAYGWLIVAALLGAWSSLEPSAIGFGGASRHAITVGFMSTLVFCIGPRMLPAFLGRRSLFSPALMFFSLLAINCGCFLRVTSQILSYQQIAEFAWIVLPSSAMIELTGFILFSLNLVLTLTSSSNVNVGRLNE
jgi:uncharacterized protein involved in response to NO